MEMLHEKRTLAVFGWILTQTLAVAVTICYWVAAGQTDAGGEKFAFVWKGFWFLGSLLTYLLLFRKPNEYSFSLFVIFSIFLNQISLVESAALPSMFGTLSGFALAYFFVSAISVFAIVYAKEEFVDVGPTFDDGGGNFVPPVPPNNSYAMV